MAFKNFAKNLGFKDIVNIEVERALAGTRTQEFLAGNN
jgi:hypothetical protein